MNNGYIKLQRNIEGTWIHNDDRYFKAWCTILLNVNWKPSKVRIGPKVLNCDVNEALFSLDTWAKKFGNTWDKEKVRRFFKRLDTHHYISATGDGKTTRLKVLESISCEDSEHDSSTIPDTITTRDPTPIEEGRREEGKEKDSFDKRKNDFLPFDVTTSSHTLKAIFQDPQLAIQRVKEIYQIDATENDIKIALHTFPTVAVASYDKYRGIRTVEKLTNKFLEWVPTSIKFEKNNTKKVDNAKPTVQDLENYILQNHRQKDLDHMKKDGLVTKWMKQLNENAFRYGNIAKTYNNPSFTVLFIFEACFLPLNRKLGGSTPQRKLDSLERWFKKLTDWEQNKGELRELLKKHNK